MFQKAKQRAAVFRQGSRGLDRDFRRNSKKTLFDAGELSHGFELASVVGRVGGHGYRSVISAPSAAMMRVALATPSSRLSMLEKPNSPPATLGTVWASPNACSYQPSRNISLPSRSASSLCP